MKKYAFAATLCVAVYWLSNSILWIPFKISALLGAICMIIYVPIAWGGISKLSLSKFSLKEKARAKYYLGVVFVVIAVLSDIIFYVVYRKVPEQLFKPATFGAYVLCFVTPVIVGVIEKKKGKNNEKSIKTTEFIIAVAMAVIFISTTFYVTRFW